MKPSFIGIATQPNKGSGHYRLEPIQRQNSRGNLDLFAPASASDLGQLAHMAAKRHHGAESRDAGGVKAFSEAATDDLITAIVDSDIARIKSAIDNNADPNAVDFFGTTALAIAAVGDDPAVVTWLLQKGALPNKPNFSDFTELMAAACSGKEENVRILLNAGAEGTLEDAYDLTAEMRARNEGYIGIADMIKRHVEAHPPAQAVE